MSPQSTISPMPYTYSTRPRKWEEVEEERNRYFRELVGPELDDWLEEVTHGQAAD